MNGTFEWAVIFATFLSVLSIVPRYCARLTSFLHPKLREINAVLITPQLMTLTLRHLRRAGSISHGLTCKEGGYLNNEKLVVLLLLFTQGEGGRTGPRCAVSCDASGSCLPLPLTRPGFQWPS